MPGSRLLSSLVLSMALVFAVAGCATNTEGESGSLSLEVVINGDTEKDAVQWTITRGGEEIKSGTINISAPGATASVEAYGLEPGGGYTIMLEAVSTDEETTCKGSAMFGIEVGEVTEVHVMMNCKPPPRYGAVRANGKFNICPVLSWTDVSPLQTSLGNDVDLSAVATDEEGDPIAYMWSSGSGIIADPMAASTTYTCTAVGDDAITILVTDDAGAYCMDMHTVPIFCVAGDGDLCEGVICEDTGNECTTAACNPGSGLCETSNVADGTSCGDGGACMGGTCIEDLCMDVVCEDDGNECTDEACNPANGLCETSNNANPCNDDTGTCNEGVCEPNPECAVAADCPATGNECIDAVCNAGTCETSNNTNACDGGAGTCNAGVCEPNDLCADVICEDDGNECTDEACNPGTGLCETSDVADGTACANDTGTCNAGVCEPNAEVVYEQDFNLLDAAASDALTLDGWLVFGNVFDSGGGFLFGFGPFGAPNGGPGFSAIVDDQGGPEQEPQQLSIYNDYNCCQPSNGHFNGTDLVEALVFQEINPIPAAFIGRTFTFSFDAKNGNIVPPTTARAYIQTLNPNTGFNQTNFVPIDMTSIGTNWNRYEISLDLTDPLLEGQILQFGFSSTTSNFTDSQNVYDNILTTLSPTP